MRVYIFIILLELEVWNLVFAGMLEDSINASATFEAKAAGKNGGIC